MDYKKGDILLFDCAKAGFKLVLEVVEYPSIRSRPEGKCPRGTVIHNTNKNWRVGREIIVTGKHINYLTKLNKRAYKVLFLENKGNE